MRPDTSTTSVKSHFTHPFDSIVFPLSDQCGLSVPDTQDSLFPVLGLIVTVTALGSGSVVAPGVVAITRPSATFGSGVVAVVMVNVASGRAVVIADSHSLTVSP